MSYEENQHGRVRIALLGKSPMQGKFGLGEIGAIFAGVLLAWVLHELTHGLVMRMYGAKPKYGILWKGLMWYATSPGYAYRRNNYVVIALAPFVFISTLVIVGIRRHRKCCGNTAWYSVSPSALKLPRSGW